LAQHKVKSVITNIDGKLEYELTINPMNNYVEDAILTGVQIIDKNSNIDVSQNYVLPEKDVDKTIQRLIIGKRKVTFYIANVSINNEDFDNFQYDSDRLASLVSSSALALGDYFVADKTIVVTKDTYKMEMYDMPTIYNASGEDVSSFYEMANSGGVVTGIISIIPTPIYLELSSHTFTYEQYGDYTPYDYSIIKETNQSLATGTWELSCDTMDKAGTYTYTLSYSGADENYLDIQIVHGVITVLPRQITATIDDLEYEYTGYNVFNSGDVNVDFSDGVYLNYTVENIQAINVGSYKYSISLLNDEDKNNYTLTENVGIVTVTPKEITVELSDLEYEYNFGHNVFNSGDVSVNFSEDSFAYYVNPTNATNVGTYTYSITITDPRANNCLFVYEGGNIVVTKKEIEVELNNLEYEYTGYNVFNPGDVSVNFSEDSFNYSINRPNAVNVGVYNYSITITDSKASNYTFTYTGGAVVVTKKTVTVTLNDLYYTYDGSVITENNLYSDAYPSFSDGGSYQWEPMAFYAQERGTYSYTIRIVDTAITNINFEVTPGKVIIQ
jgi:hypothetical protein